MSKMNLTSCPWTLKKCGRRLLIPGGIYTFDKTDFDKMDK